MALVVGVLVAVVEGVVVAAVVALVAAIAGMVAAAAHCGSKQHDIDINVETSNHFLSHELWSERCKQTSHAMF